MPPESAIDPLGDFQGALLELLAQDLSLETLQQRLHEEPAFAPFRDYVQDLSRACWKWRPSWSRSGESEVPRAGK